MSADGQHPTVNHCGSVSMTVNGTGGNDHGGAQTELNPAVGADVTALIKLLR